MWCSTFFQFTLNSCIQCECFHLWYFFVIEEAQGCPDLGCLDRVQEITVHETVEIMEGMNIN